MSTFTHRSKPEAPRFRGASVSVYGPAAQPTQLPASDDAVWLHFGDIFLVGKDRGVIAETLVHAALVAARDLPESDDPEEAQALLRTNEIAYRLLDAIGRGDQVLPLVADE